MTKNLNKLEIAALSKMLEGPEERLSWFWKGARVAFHVAFVVAAAALTFAFLAAGKVI